MHNRTFAVAAAALLVAGTSADAQGKGRGKNDVPPGHRPPAGMCRVWIDDVPPGRQPAPTDCVSAVRNRPPNARVLYGDDAAKPGRGVARRERGDRARNRDRERDRRDVVLDRCSSAATPHERELCEIEQRRRERVVRDRVATPREGTIDRSRYPEELPMMTGAVLIRNGVRTTDVQRWLGDGAYTSRFTDSNGDGVPDVASWYDREGTLVQVWRDADRDGRADEVEIHRAGRMAGVIR
jgi:hypothetical protein